MPIIFVKLPTIKFHESQFRSFFELSQVNIKMNRQAWLSQELCFQNFSVLTQQKLYRSCDFGCILKVLFQMVNIKWDTSNFRVNICISCINGHGICRMIVTAATFVNLFIETIWTEGNWLFIIKMHMDI